MQSNLKLIPILCAFACMQFGCENSEQNPSAVWDVPDKAEYKAQDMGKMAGLDWNNKTGYPEISLKVLQIMDTQVSIVYGETQTEKENVRLLNLMLANIKIDFDEKDWSFAYQSSEWFVQNLDSMFNVDPSWSTGYNRMKLGKAFVRGAKTGFSK